jgi:broad specificity phosphatase PhoE
VRHAATRATRSAAFPVDEPLDDRAPAAVLGALLPARSSVLTSPALRCRQTAQAAGLDARVVPDIRGCDFGRWAGSSLEEVAACEADDVSQWMTDPDAAPHGGESLAAFSARVAGWLADQAAQDGVAIAITHAELVKAAVVHALAAPFEAFWRIDAAPLSLTELHAHDGRWTLTRLNHPLASAA